MRILAWGIMIFALAVSAWAYLWTDADGDLDEDRQTSIPVILHQMDFKDFAERGLTAHIIAEEARMFEEEKLAHLDNIYGTFYPEDKMKEPAKLKAEKGLMEGSKELMTLWGNVEVNFEGHRKLNTEKLYYAQNKELLHTDLPVLMTSPEEEITASSMKYLIKQGDLTLTQPIMQLELE